MPSQQCFKQTLKDFITENPTAKSFHVSPGLTVQPLYMADEKDSAGGLIIGFPEEQIGQSTVIDIAKKGNFTVKYEGHIFPLEFFRLSEDDNIFHPCIVADDNLNPLFDNKPIGGMTSGDRYQLIDLYESIEYVLHPISNKTKKSSIIAADLIDDFFELLADDKSKRCICAIAYYTASRISEVLSLKIDDLSPTTIRFREENSKSKTAREIEISVQLKFYLDGYTKPSKGYLFPSIRGDGNVNQKYIGVAKYLKKIGTTDQRFDGLNTSSFLRSATRHMHDAGFTDKEIGAFVGLKSTRTKNIRALFED
jgi:hypothetical protein